MLAFTNFWMIKKQRLLSILIFEAEFSCLSYYFFRSYNLWRQDQSSYRCIFFLLNIDDFDSFVLNLKFVILCDQTNCLSINERHDFDQVSLSFILHFIDGFFIIYFGFNELWFRVAFVSFNEQFLCCNLQYQILWNEKLECILMIWVLMEIIRK